MNGDVLRRMVPSAGRSPARPAMSAARSATSPCEMCPESDIESMPAAWRFRMNPWNSSEVWASSLRSRYSESPITVITTSPRRPTTWSAVLVACPTASSTAGCPCGYSPNWVTAPRSALSRSRMPVSLMILPRTIRAPFWPLPGPGGHWRSSQIDGWPDGRGCRAPRVRDHGRSARWCESAARR